MTAVQQYRALQRANDTRQRRAVYHRELCELGSRLGAATLAADLSAPPDWLTGADIAVAVAWVPRYGPTRTRNLLSRLHVAERRLVGELTERQRDAIAAALVAGGW